MNIETNSNITTTAINSTTSSGRNRSRDNAGFADELSSLSEVSRKEETEKTKASEKEKEADKTKETEEAKEDQKAEETPQETKPAEETDSKEENKDKTENKNEQEEHSNSKENEEDKDSQNINNVMDGLKNVLEEMNKLNQTDDKLKIPVKPNGPLTDKDKKDEDDGLINNNDMNIQEPKDPFNQQMNANMNFNSNNGQPFNAYVKQQELAINEKDLAEEKNILSTMSENIAIANKNMMLAQNTQEQAIETEQTNQRQNIKTVRNESGVKKVDTKSNITVETVVKYDNVIMNKSDVDFFVNLVENGSANIDTQQALKSSQVSKTLADLIAKSMKDNQPVRIDFDNNISVIIKISREGKISADFLPSSQVAEAYLKENLPLLRQRFDDNNIEYDELNERRQKQDDDKENRRKDRKDE